MTTKDVIAADGPYPTDVLIVGERPGWEEYRAHRDELEWRNFVGPAGQELWDRLDRLVHLDRSACRVANLVPTFSDKPPTPAEIAVHAWRLQREIRRVRPKIIITVGYHAARWFLPQFKDVDGDRFHGLAFPYDYGRIRRHRAVVVPLVHSSAALRQPARYQYQLSRDVGHLATVVQAYPKVRYHTTRRYVPTPSGLACFLGSRLLMGVDTEYAAGEVEAVTLALDELWSAIVEPKQSPAALPHLRKILSEARLVAHAAPAEYHSLLKLGVERWDDPLDDTMIMAYVLGMEHRSLKVILYRELGIEQPEYGDIVNPVDNLKMRSWLKSLRKELRPIAKQGKVKIGKRLLLAEETKTARRAERSIKKLIAGVAQPEQPQTIRSRWIKSVWGERYTPPPAASWQDAPAQIRQPYALGDAIGAVQVAGLLWPRVVEQGLRRVYELDRNVLPFLVRNEHVGIAVDGEGLRDLSAQFEKAFAANQLKIDALAGHAVNPLSGEQVSDCLFHELGVTPTRLTKSEKHHTTADKYLKARRGEHQIINLILDSRQLNKYKGTYTEKLPLMLKDGRYHPDWLYATTVTGRLAEQVLVLIPKHDLLAKIMNRENRAKAIRDCFYAVGRNRLVSVDLSQIELRVMAHLSGDKRLLKVFRTGGDMHALVAADLLGAPRDKSKQDESLHRLPAKTFNFGIINGMTEYGMLDQLHEAGQLHWTIEQVRDFRTEWFKTYKGVDEFWRDQIYHARRYGYVVSMFGRRRFLHGVRSTSDQVRTEAERQCLFAIQSTADDISKLWNIRIWKKIIRPAHTFGYYCEPWVRVHDDTTLEVDKQYVANTAGHMLQLVPDLLSVPTTAEAKWGKRWGSLDKLEKSA